MLKRLPQTKRICVVLILIGAAFLILSAVMIPLRTASATVKTVCPIIGLSLVLPCVPVMWKDGIRAMKEKPSPVGHWLRMRQSGFFDVLVFISLIAAVLILLGLFGMVSWNITFSRHAALAAGDGPVPATLEQARALDAFVEYNFKQDLNIFAGSWRTYLVIGAVLLGFTVLCLLYMRFVTPIVRADEKLQIAHGIYKVVAQYAGAILIVLISLFPIYWMIISSFKTRDELLLAVPTLWPKRFILENYPNVLQRAPFGRYLVNTLATTVVIMMGELTIGVMAAYGFSKGEFKGKNTLFMLVLGALMVPIQVTFVPIYVLISRLNLIDTWAGVILPNLVSAYFIFMLRQNFMAVDNSYIEAGRIDGMGRFGAIIHVLCPMCKPTLITISIISFINGWNSYFWPKMVTQSAASRTIAVGVQLLKETYSGQFVSNYNEIMAGAVMAIIPIVALFLILQKYIMTGMSKAAMK